MFKQISRVLTEVVSLLVLLSLAARCPAEPPQAPNIVLIVSDDQGYHDLGCFGSTETRTPNLDRLAAGGVRLTSFYVTWPACPPSRGSLLTGRYPQRNGLYDMIRNDRVDDGHANTPEENAVWPEMYTELDITRYVGNPKHVTHIADLDCVAHRNAGTRC